MFAPDAHRPAAEICLTGPSAGSSDVAQEHGWRDSDVLDLCSPDQTSDASLSSPSRGHCHSDPGALPHTNQTNTSWDHDEWVLGPKAHVNEGTRFKPDARQDSEEREWGSEKANHDARSDIALWKNAKNRRRPTRRLLPLWDSASPGKIDAKQTPAPDECQIDHGNVTGRRSGGHETSLSSPAGLQTPSRGVLCRTACETQIQQAFTSTPASDPAESVSGYPSSLENQASDSEIGSHDADEQCSDRHVDRYGKDDAPCNISPNNTDHYLAVENFAQQDSPDGPSKQTLTGAQRRRLRRQQELELMQMTDPQGWSRLQRTMQAMMPYGWDKYAYQPAKSFKHLLQLPFCVWGPIPVQAINVN